MVIKTKTYVDTSAFIAFLDKSDTNHITYKKLFSDPPKLLTTTAVIIEGHGWFLRRYDGFRALQFLNFIEDLTVLTIVDVTKNDILNAKALIKKFLDQNLTLVDALGLAILEKTGIKECWSTDRHLSLLGTKLA
jgi:predicted nucleic acid-binding protein